MTFGRLILVEDLSFAAERLQHAAHLSPAFSAFLAAAARHELHTVFAEVDVLLVPSAEGKAPAGLASTGDPVFNRMWTLLGVPCVHVPLGSGTQGLPIGVTVVGPRWADAEVLAAADLLQRCAIGIHTGDAHALD